MQNALKAVSVLALLFTWCFTISALYGPRRLPPRIPIHFDAAGHANGWGTPATLCILPMIATGIYALMAWVTRHPSAFNYPVRVTPANRPRLEALGIGMIGWLKAEVVSLFAWIQWATIESARHGSTAISPRTILVAILVIWATIIGYFVSMVRTGRRVPRA